MPPIRGTNVPIVHPIDENTRYKHPPPPYADVLPAHEFSALMIAPRGSGKSTLILNFITDFYKHYFHIVRIFSPTSAGDIKFEKAQQVRGVLAQNPHKHLLENKGAAHGKGSDSDSDSDEAEPDEKTHGVRQGAGRQGPIDPALFEQSFQSLFGGPVFRRTVQVGDRGEYGGGSVNFKGTAGPPPQASGSQSKKDKKWTGKLNKKHMYSDYDPDLLDSIMNETMANIRKYKKAHKDKTYADRQLLVFDDLVGSNLFTSKRHDPFRRLITTMRHFSTSVLLVSQGYKEIPKTARINTNLVILFEINNAAELECVYEENTCGLPKDEWLSVYRECTVEPFSFLTINYSKPKGHRLWLRFEQDLNIMPNQGVADTGQQLRQKASPNAPGHIDGTKNANDPMHVDHASDSDEEHKKHH